MNAAAALAPGAAIGIVGGGQLGRMTAIAAARLGFRAVVLDPAAAPPAADVAHHLRAAYDDTDALDRFAALADVITFEFENVSASALARLAARRPVRPAPSVLGISQDRAAEKSFLNKAGIATAPWRSVHDEASLQSALAAIGRPALLKTTRFGYDGKGQVSLRTEAEITSALASLGPGPFVLEGRVDFACELSVIVARGLDGTLRAFDPVENRHRDGILALTLAPAPIAPAVAAEASAIAERVATALDLVGLLAVEMFVDRDGRVLVNELAPRPHNSGHWTIEACLHDQFALHARAVGGLALPSPRRHSDAVMINLLGPAGRDAWPRLLLRPDISPHWYGKPEARPGRKLGHATMLFPLGALPGPVGLAASIEGLVDGS